MLMWPILNKKLWSVPSIGSIFRSAACGLLLFQQVGISEARDLLVAGNGHSIQVEVLGEGQPIVLIPSLGRGAEDFVDLKNRLVLAGYKVILPQPRGIGESTENTKTDISLSDLADDVHIASSAVTDKPVVVLGHAFGNRVARAFVSRYPEQTKGLILLAAGGASTIQPEIMKALRDCFRLDLPDDQHLEAIRLAFFAKGNDPTVWRGGWYPEVARYQEVAIRNTPLEKWWSAGKASMLVIQAAEDRVAPPENAEKLLKTYPDRVQVKILKHAGHAMLPEQPELISELIINWLREQH